MVDEELVRADSAKEDLDAGLLSARAELRSWTGDFVGARDDFEQALQGLQQDDPCRELAAEGFAVAYNREAFRLVEEGQTEQAIFLIKRAMDLAPEWVGLHVNLGRMFMALERNKKARAEFEAAIAGDGEDPIAWFNLGHVQREMGEPEASVISFDKVLELDIDYPDVRPELAAAYHDLRRFEDAARLLEEELGDDDTCTACNHNLGLAYLELEQPDKAEARFRKATELDASYFRARYNLAGALVRLGRHDDAMTELITAHGLDSTLMREWLSEDRVEFATIAGRPEFQRLLKEP
jgi:tetratricopeptide (TPR) repeat protein